MTLLTTHDIKMVHKPFIGQYQASARKKRSFCLAWTKRAGLQPNLYYLTLLFATGEECFLEIRFSHLQVGLHHIL